MSRLEADAMESDELDQPIVDAADVTGAVLGVGRLARAWGCDPVTRSMLMTAASELASNILKYAGRGTLRVRRVPEGPGPGASAEIEARDRGPGIADVARALTDRFSTSGTLGLGLPGVRRMMDHFEIDSAPGRGTLVRVRKRLR